MGECFPDAEEVEGSIPSAPTIEKCECDQTKKVKQVFLSCRVQIDFNG